MEAYTVRDTSALRGAAVDVREAFTRMISDDWGKCAATGASGEHPSVRDKGAKTPRKTRRFPSDPADLLIEASG